MFQNWQISRYEGSMQSMPSHVAWGELNGHIGSYYCLLLFHVIHPKNMAIVATYCHCKGTSMAETYNKNAPKYSIQVMVCWKNWNIQSMPSHVGRTWMDIASCSSWLEQTHHTSLMCYSKPGWHITSHFCFLRLLSLTLYLGVAYLLILCSVVSTTWSIQSDGFYYNLGVIVLKSVFNYTNKKVILWSWCQWSCVFTLTV